MPYLLAGFAGLFFVIESAWLHHKLFYALPVIWLMAAILPAGIRKACDVVDKRILTLILIYAAYQAVSLSWSPAWSGQELGEVIRKALLTLLWVFMIAGVLAEEKNRNVFWEILVAIASVSAALALYWHYTAALPAERMNGLGRSLNPVQGGSLYGWALIGSFFLWIREKRVEWCLCSIVLLLALLATQSRGALLAALMALALFTVMSLRAMPVRKWKVGVVVTAALLLLVMADWQQIIARADSFRLQIWQEVISAWWQHPLFGMGYRAPFETTLPYGATIFQPHSIYMTALYYGGITGLLLLLGLFSMVAYRAWIRRDTPLLALIAYGALLGTVDYSLLLVNGNIEWLFFWLPVGMALAGRKGTFHPDKCQAHGAGRAKRRGDPSSTLKILHSLFSNGIGGTERHLADLANAQVRAGHEVKVMLRADRHPYAGPDILREWLLPEVEVVFAPRRWPLIPLWLQLRKMNPDIIHTHHRRDSRYLAQAAPQDVPVVATLHMPFRKQDYRRHQGLICVSAWQLADVPNLPNRHRTVIPNWIMPAPEISEEDRAALRKRAGVGEEEMLLGAVGRLTAEKGIEDLVGAFLKINPLNVTLCIFGEGECRAAIERRIASVCQSDQGEARSGGGSRQAGGKAPFHIKLMGYEPDIRRWYSAFDGFVLPSRYETFGLVLLEAMTARLPILSTRTRGALDVLGTDAQITWAEANHPEDLAKRLKEFLPKLGMHCDYPQLVQYRPEQAFVKVEKFYRLLIEQ